MTKLTISILYAGILIPSIAFADETAVKSSEVMLNEASSGVAHVEKVITDGQNMLSQAKEEADVARMDCLNVQLINAKGYYNVVQNSEANLRDAVSRGDSAAQQHHYKLVQLAVSKTDNIAVKMTECMTGVLGSLSGGQRQDTQRVCAIEPCLGGEEYYDSSVKSEIQYMEQSSIDASPYL